MLADNKHVRLPAAPDTSSLEPQPERYLKFFKATFASAASYSLDMIHSQTEQ